MTQLIIAGVETVLPQQFSVTVKRENPFFTKSGEYTYDATLRLDNPVNQQLYGFLHRLNYAGQVPTGRSAVLVSDGRVYCRGTEVITRWNQETVSVQVVSGESELNFFIGQDRMMHDLDLGTAPVPTMNDLANTYPQADYCAATVRTPSGMMLNRTTTARDFSTGSVTYQLLNPAPQPFLCALLRRTIAALGYTVGTNQLEQTQMRHLFLVNAKATRDYADMLAGWTVKEFLEEVEKLCGVVFVTDNLSKQCDVLLKTVYYQEARQLTLNDVTDEYETEVVDDEGRDAEFTTSDVGYDMPDHRWAKFMELPEQIVNTAEWREYASLALLRQDAENVDTDKPVLMRDTSTGRTYMRTVREVDAAGGFGNDETPTRKDYQLMEVDQFRRLDREDNTSTLELKITPAPMMYLGYDYREVIDLGTDDGYKNRSGNGGETDDVTDDDEEEKSFEDSIRDYSEEKVEQVDLYCAFSNGTTCRGGTYSVAYTDAYHAVSQFTVLGIQNVSFDSRQPEGSLRLADLDGDYYQGGYEIDTRHRVKVETYDPNMADPRQVYVVRNRRYVCRDVEETLTAEGRKPKWKATLYPITISDEAIEKRWVLTKGVWDDGAAWLDDGRWNDE